MNKGFKTLATLSKIMLMDVKVLNSQVLLFISICCMFQMNTYDEMLWSSIEYGEHGMSLLKKNV